MTDESKLKVICPLRYRLYADYIHNNVPYRTEEVELLPHDPKAHAEHDLTGVPAIEDLIKVSGKEDTRLPVEHHWDQSALDCQYLTLPYLGAPLDEPITVSDLPSDMTPEEVVEDPYIGKRTKTRAELIAEATSAHHLAGHYEHNPFCEICALSHLKHQRYAHKPGAKKDEQLVPITKKNQCLSCDGIIVAKNHSDVSRLAADGSAVAITVMDQFSGCVMVFPTASAAKNKYYLSLIHI